MFATPAKANPSAVRGTSDGPVPAPAPAPVPAPVIPESFFGVMSMVTGKGVHAAGAPGTAGAAGAAAGSSATGTT